MNLSKIFDSIAILLAITVMMITLSSCSIKNNHAANITDESSSEVQTTQPAIKNYSITNGTYTYRDFIVDNILHSDNNGDIHFNIYIPKSYDGSEAYALFITLPGYEGLYFQGVGVNIHQENFGFEAQKYNENMIIVAPQLNGWDENSADETITLVEYLLSAYNIDKSMVYIEGYSGGGETASQAVSKRPDLFTAYLQVSSQWDGEYESIARSKLPVYIVIGRDDEYYGSKKSQDAYDTLYNLYKNQGLTDEEINKILVLDIKERDYFTSRNAPNEHGGGGLFAEDNTIMSWLFGDH
ncbi:MAG: prolyl oligopeptidase family serine peptidase [Erysipelotrichia bacterium]|nr:prolyl oligopeptidase family serine peptidase [Erysipelotrichia bacterium]